MSLNVDTIYTAAVADEQHTLADAATNGVFGELAESTKGFTDREAWEKEVRAFETEYMQATQGSNPDAMTKGRGKAGSKSYTPPRWKYAKFLPKAWSSSKSVCGSAIENGLTIDKDSGKTATEEKIKEIKNDLKSEKTPREKFKIAMDTAAKVIKDLPDQEKLNILKDAGINPAESIFYWGV